MPTPGRSGYTFIGWFTAPDGGNKVTGNETITEDVTYYAQWSLIEIPSSQNTFTVTFDPQGGHAVNSQTVTENSALPYIPITSRDGYIFMGWYKYPGGNGGQLTSSTTITSNTVYHAYWLTPMISGGTGNANNNVNTGNNNNTTNTNTTPVPEYVSDVNVSVGNGHEGEYIPINKQVGLYNSLVNYYPCKSGYAFQGWYLDANYTQPLTPDTVLTSNTVVYQKWIELHNWKLNKKKATLKVGQTTTMKVVGLSNSKVKWKSLNPDIATVSANGKVKAKKAGKAQIIAITEDGSVIGCTITVKKKK